MKVGLFMLGKVLFYVLWPLIWMYSPLVRRVRVYIEYEDTILLVRNWFGPQTWQLPGGGIKFGESVLSAARRELHEELALDLPNTARITTDEVVVVQQFGLLMRYHIVQCRFKTKPVLKQNREIVEYIWAKPDSLRVAPEVTAARNTL